MALLPAAEQLAAVDVIVGVIGVANTAALLKGAETKELQLPLSDITV